MLLESQSGMDSVEVSRWEGSGCRWDVLRLKPKRRPEDANIRRQQGQLGRGKDLREIVPSAGEAWGLGGTGVAGRLAQAVEVVPQVAHEAVAVTDHLSTAQLLERFRWVMLS